MKSPPESEGNIECGPPSLEIGMIADSVEFLLGQPDTVMTIRREWGPQEQWEYRQGDLKYIWLEKNRVVGIKCKKP